MKWDAHVTWMSVVTMVTTLIKKGDSLACFRCNSLDGSDTECEDNFEPYHLKGHILERDCRVGPLDYESFFCVKIKGIQRDTDKPIVIRTCTAVDWGTQCGLIALKQGPAEDAPDETIEGCVASCDFDGCNGSQDVKYHSSLTLNIVIATLIISSLTRS